MNLCCSLTLPGESIGLRVAAARPATRHVAGNRARHDCGRDWRDQMAALAQSARLLGARRCWCVCSALRIGAIERTKIWLSAYSLVCGAWTLLSNSPSLRCMCNLRAVIESSLFLVADAAYCWLPGFGVLNSMRLSAFDIAGQRFTTPTASLLKCSIACKF